MTGYSIGQLASAAGIPISTIRFYERTGLFKPDARTDANYRQYSEQALERLKFIRSAQATGFSLEDIGRLLSLTHSDDPPCDDVIELTRARLADVRQRVKELRHVERVLAKSLATCCKGDDPDLCRQIIHLKRGNGSSCRPKKKTATAP